MFLFNRIIFQNMFFSTTKLHRENEMWFSCLWWVLQPNDEDSTIWHRVFLVNLEKTIWNVICILFKFWKTFRRNYEWEHSELRIRDRVLINKDSLITQDFISKSDFYNQKNSRQNFYVHKHRSKAHRNLCKSENASNLPKIFEVFQFRPNGTFGYG